MADFPDGVHVALVTPLTAAQEYAAETMERLLAAVRPCVQGISILGTTGEGPSFTPERQREVVRHVVRCMEGGQPVSCGVAATSAEAAVQRLKALADLGVAAGLVLPPFYYPLTPEEVSAFYHTVADGSPIPILIYHIPQLTKILLTPEQVSGLAKHPNIAGLKDSSLNFGFFQRVRQVAPRPFKVFIGSDELLATAKAVGGNGAICASPNVFPQLAARIWQDTGALSASPDRKAERMLTRLVDAMREHGGVRAWKAAVEHVHGLPAQPKLPLHPLAEEHRRMVCEIVSGLMVS